MTRNAILLENICADELRQIIKDELKKAFEKNTSAFKNPSEEYLTTTEAARMLKVNKATLHNWRKNNILMPITIGRRVLYRLSDIEAKMST